MAMQIATKKILQQRFGFRMIHVGSFNNSLPTDFFQKSLPYLPLPTLEESMALYLERQIAVCNPEEFGTIENMANRFVQGNGKALQKQFVDCYNKDKFAYYGRQHYVNTVLKKRNSTLDQTNGTTIWNLGRKDPQLLRASKMVYSLGKLVQPLRNNTLEPTVMNYNPFFESVLKQTKEDRRTQVAFGLGMIPFDMQSHPYSFGGCRIPGINMDTISNSDTSKNFVVIRNGHLFSFDLLTETGEVIAINEIYGTLKEIKEQSETPSSLPIAALTILDRPLWAKYRNYLVTDPNNANLLKIIEESLAVLTLDGHFETDDNLQKNIYLGKHPGNRWFDKSAYISCDANSEYSGFGGNSVEVHAVVAIDIGQRARDVYESIGDVSINTASKSSTLKLLQFNVDDYIQSGIKQAEKENYAFRDKFQCEPFARTEVNNGEFKKRFLNPSAMVHLALQIALIKMYDKPKILSSTLLSPSFINGHTFDSLEPTTLMADIAQKFADEEKMEMSLLRKYSDRCYSDIIQKRMGFDLFKMHLMALHDLSLEIDQPCDFLTSQLFDDSLQSLVNVITVPHKVATNIVFSEFYAGLAFTYLFNPDGMYGSFMSNGKGPDMKEYSNLFFETMERLIHHISK